MKSIPSQCIRKHQDNTFTVKKQLSEVQFVNASKLHVEQYQIDGCILGDGGPDRCDWLINALQDGGVRGNDKSILVELKGSDIDKAISQLATSHDMFSHLINRHVTWIVSYSGSPRFSTAIATRARNVRIEKRATLVVEKSICTHRIS